MSISEVKVLAVEFAGVVALCVISVLLGSYVTGLWFDIAISPNEFLLTVMATTIIFAHAFVAISLVANCLWHVARVRS